MSVLTAMDFTDTDRAIIEVLREGTRTPAYIVDKTGYTRQHIYHRLEVLQAAGHVERIHDRSALYDLVDDPDTEAVDLDALLTENDGDDEK